MVLRNRRLGLGLVGGAVTLSESLFPNEPAVIRLVGAVLADMHDERQDSDRRQFSEGSIAKLGPTTDMDTPQQRTARWRTGCWSGSCQETGQVRARPSHWGLALDA